MRLNFSKRFFLFYAALINVIFELPKLSAQNLESFSLEQFSYLFTNIVSKSLPSIVKVAVSKRIDSSEQLFYGSGFLITSDGYIATCEHVVKDASKITVYFQNLEIEAVLVEKDPEKDLAILKIDGLNLPYLTLGDSDALKVGEWIVSIGYPFSMQPFVTKGILGAKDKLLFTDILINPGNSGGPLLNLKGEVIGISSALLQSNEELRGVGIAIPSLTLVYFGHNAELTLSRE